MTQEFREDLHDITRQKSRDRDGIGEAGITLRHINMDKYHQEFAVKSLLNYLLLARCGADRQSFGSSSGAVEDAMHVFSCLYMQVYQSI